MKLAILKSAQKAFASVQPKLVAALLIALKDIAADPFGLHPNAKRLKGGEDGFRLRHGDWRALYRLDHATDTMTVTAVNTRGDVYE